MSHYRIVIPTLNEEENIVAAIRSVRNNFESVEDDCSATIEVIVVDGGSTDATVRLARRQGVEVRTECPKGRAAQMNLGASGAKKETILVFLHADSRLPPRFNLHVRGVLHRPRVIAGAFRLGLDSKRRGIRTIEFFANFRSKYLQLPFGDQSMFLRNRTFEAVGGFPHVPFMEDFEMCRILRKRGRIGITDPGVVSLSSARRWEKHGLFRTTLLNQVIIGCRYLGVPLETLARWYRSLR